MERSHANFGPGQQKYALIEHVNSPEALFGKIESGRYDWLGTQEKGGRYTYWVGSPRASSLEGFASATAIHSGPDGVEPTGRHKVVVKEPRPVEMPPSESWYLTPEEARAAYEKQLADLLEGRGSAIYRVSLYVDGDRVEREFVVRSVANRR